MGYIGDTPISVNAGGTGRATLTDGGVLVGNGTSGITQLAVGGNGDLLRGTTGADPVFSQTCPGSFNFTRTVSGSNTQLNIVNNDNTSGASTAVLHNEVGGTSSGDPLIQYSVSGATTFSHGIDNSDSDSLKVSASSALGTTDTFIITTSGVVTFPLNSCFLAYLPSTDANVTGNGASYSLGSVTALTEIFDLHGDFNTNGTFTAPITGRYDLRSFIYVSDTTIATSFVVTLTTSNRSYSSTFSRAALAADQSSIISVIADMDTNDTATVAVVANGEAGNTDDVSGGTPLLTYFCGSLVA